ncbi:MAG: head-tail adaptor protein [Aliishimia sp.]
MQPGQFDTRVTFEEKVRVPNGGGGHNIEWREMSAPGQGGRWAAVWPVSQGKGDEENSGSRVGNAVSYWVTVRTDEATRFVKSDWRVLIDDEPFAIKSLARPDRTRGTIKMIVQTGQPT